MNDQRNNASPPANIGISLLLVVFLILCLFTFSAIALVQADVVEFKAVLNSIFLDEKADFVGRGVLKPAVLYVQHSVKVSAYVKT